MSISERFQERQEQVRLQEEKAADQAARKKRRTIGRTGRIGIGVTTLAILGSMPFLFSAIAGEPLDPNSDEEIVANVVQDPDAEEVTTTYATDESSEESPVAGEEDSSVAKATEDGSDFVLVDGEGSERESEIAGSEDSYQPAPTESTAVDGESVPQDTSMAAEGMRATEQLEQSQMVGVSIPTIQSGAPLSEVQEYSSQLLSEIRKRNRSARIQPNVPDANQSPAPSLMTEDELSPIEEATDPDESTEANVPRASAQAWSGEGFEAYDNSDVVERIAIGLRNYDSSIDISDYGIAQSEVSDVLFDVMNNNPEFFYVSQLYQCIQQDGIICTIYPTYLYSRTEVSGMKYTFNDRLDEMISWTAGCSTDVEKIKAMHDYLCKHTTYKQDVATDSMSVYTAYGALVNRECVCQGYTLALRAGLNKQNIPSSYVLGGNHIWNLVKIDNNWYHIDVTSDDTASLSDGTPSAEFFMKSDAYMRQFCPSLQSSYQATNTMYDTATWPVYPIIEEQPENDTTTGDGATVQETGDGWVPVNPTDGQAPFDSSQWTLVTQSTDVKDATVTGIVNKTYTGAAQTQSITVTLNGVKLVPGEDYVVEYTNNTNVGTATMTLRARGFLYTGTLEKTFKINKAQNPLTVAIAHQKISTTYNASGTQSTARNANANKAQGTVSYANSSTDATAKKFAVNTKTGTVTIPKATKTGTYTMKVSVTAAGNANYGKLSKAVSYKIEIQKVGNPLKATAVKRTASLSKVRKGNVTVSRPARVTKAQGTVTYTKKSGSSRLTINRKTGKVTVKKGTKKGSYTIKFTVTAAGNANYKATTKTVTTTVTVK